MNWPRGILFHLITSASVPKFSYRRNDEIFAGRLLPSTLLHRFSPLGPLAQAEIRITAKIISVNVINGNF
jgi:hypothetical protein